MHSIKISPDDILPTVRVVDEDVAAGFKIINESDLRPGDVLFAELADAPRKRGRPVVGKPDANSFALAA
jgi:hypothetical protein